MTTSPSKKNWLIFLFFPVPFLFYWYTCLPSIGLGDSVLFIHAIKQLKISTWVNNHNLTAIWGWLVQFLPIGGDIAYKGNISCALAGSFAICIFYLAVYLAHRCWITAVISSLFLMISHSMWWHSTDLADYAMNAVFTSVAIYLYVLLNKTNLSKYLYWLFFVSGFALFQHYLLGSLLIGSIAALSYKLFKREEKAWPLLWKSAIFFLIGIIPWILTFLYDVSLNHSISQTLSGCFGGPFKKLFFKQPLWKGLVEYFTLVFIQFPSFYILPVAASLYFFIRAWSFRAGIVGLIFSFLPIVYFDLGLDSWAVFAQLLPTFIILAFWASFAVNKLVHYSKTLKSFIFNSFLVVITVFSFIWTIFFYSHLSIWGENPNSIWYSRFNNSYTPNCYRLNEFLANPNKRNYHDISNFCHLLLKKLPPNAEYWDSDSRLFFQVKEYYQKYYHLRPDLNIQLINSFGFSGWGADKDTFALRLKRAYSNGKNIFICSTAHPFASLLKDLPYKFNKFYLNETAWVYKLQTVKDDTPEDNSLWGRWDVIPIDKPVLINLTLDNIFDFHEGTSIFQQDMTNFGLYWKNDDQIFFSPERIGSQIGFLLRFDKAFIGNVTMSITTAFDAGMIEVLLNNKPITQEPIDLYTIGVSNKKFELKNVTFESGNNIISIQVIGKNEKSSDMKLGVDTIEVNKTSS